MTGTIFIELSRYLEGALGAQARERILDQAHPGRRDYQPQLEYPDQEFVKILEVASKESSLPALELQENFGAFIVPTLVNMYHPFLRPEWRTLDLIQNTERAIHHMVRIRNPSASPPSISAKRLSQSQVQVTYNSARRLCGFAKGIILGLARHYREEVALHEAACMLRGDPHCQISVSLKPNSI